MGNKILLISDIAKVKGGKRLPKGVRLQKERNSHPYIRVKDFGPRTLELDDSFEYVDSVTQKLISQYTVNEGDVLLSIVGTIGLVGIVGRSLDQANLTENCVKIFGLDSVDSKFLYYYLVSSYGQREISNRTVGAVQAKLPIKNIKSMPVYFPSRGVRERIVSVLSSLDTKIEINNRINDYLEQLLLARYDYLFSSKSAHNGTIADIGDVVGGATPSKKKPEYYCHDGIGWITPRDLSNTSDKFIAHGADDITQAGFDSCSVKKLPAGTVLFSSRAPIGYIAIATDNVTTNQGFKSVVPHKEIGTAFVYCFLVRNKDRIADAGSGTTFPEVSGKTMASAELTLPDVNLCAEFEGYATPLLEQQRCLEEESRQLGNLRDALLPKLMSGEIDVSRVDATQLNNHLCDCSALPFF